MAPSAAPSLVIFDCDGVLVDSETLSNSVIARSLSRHGLPLTTDQAMAMFVGKTMPGVEREAKALGATLPANWLDMIDDEIHHTLKEQVTPVPGIKLVLDTLERASIPFCVASNGSDEKMETTLTASGLASRLPEKHRFSALTIGKPKPAPDLFLWALREMGGEPATSVVIEDSATGAAAARAAGLTCNGFAPTGSYTHLAQEGAEVFSSMTELPQLLGL